MLSPEKSASNFCKISAILILGRMVSLLEIESIRWAGTVSSLAVILEMTCSYSSLRRLMSSSCLVCAVYSPEGFPANICSVGPPGSGWPEGSSRAPVTRSLWQSWRISRLNLANPLIIKLSYFQSLSLIISPRIQKKNNNWKGEMISIFVLNLVNWKISFCCGMIILCWNLKASNVLFQSHHCDLTRLQTDSIADIEWLNL